MGSVRSTEAESYGLEGKKSEASLCLRNETKEEIAPLKYDTMIQWRLLVVTLQSCKKFQLDFFFFFVFFKVEIISLNIKDFFVMGLGLDNRQTKI